MRTWVDIVEGDKSDAESKVSCQEEHCGTPKNCQDQSSTCDSLHSAGSRRDVASLNDASDAELENAAHQMDDAAKSDSSLHAQGIPVLMEVLPDGSMVFPRNLITTFMMKNIRNKVTQQQILNDLEANGFWGAFDFFYMPIDPDTKGNLGYAFINLSMCAVPAFLKFCKEWQIGKLDMGQQWSCRGIDLVEAGLQGFAANYGFYSNKRKSWHADPSAQPLFLREALPEEEITIQAHSFVRKRGSDGRRPRGSTRRREQCKYEHPAVCHQCSGQVYDSHKFCGHCGAKL